MTTLTEALDDLLTGGDEALTGPCVFCGFPTDRLQPGVKAQLIAFARARTEREWLTYQKEFTSLHEVSALAASTRRPARALARHPCPGVRLAYWTNPHRSVVVTPLDEADFEVRRAIWRHVSTPSDVRAMLSEEFG